MPKTNKLKKIKGTAQIIKESAEMNAEIVKEGVCLGCEICVAEFRNYVKDK